MSIIKSIITQSNYIPWKGYFDSISKVDIFVVYDDMQYTKRDWRNRNQIKTPQGLKWLSIPVEVSGKYFQKIKDTRVADLNWNNNHWEQIRQNYSEAKCFREMKEWLEPLFRNCNYTYLTDINLHFIIAINNFFKIETKILNSSDFELLEERTERLVHICKSTNTTDYYSGPAAKSYMLSEKFSKENISVHYFDYSNYPIYNQLHGDFIHSVSVIDLILNEGHNSHKYLSNNNE